jgi:hypothetical protein
VRIPPPHRIGAIRWLERWIEMVSGGKRVVITVENGKTDPLCSNHAVLVIDDKTYHMGSVRDPGFVDRVSRVAHGHAWEASGVHS